MPDEDSAQASGTDLTGTLLLMIIADIAQLYPGGIRESQQLSSNL
jgi:hypothetical protein